MPPPYRAREQVAQHLAQIRPSPREYWIHEIDNAWVCHPIPTDQERNSSRLVGMTSLVVDAETGIVLQYPSWSREMIAEDYTTARQTGRRPKARQIYPPKTRVTLRLTNETADQIQYQISATSDTNRENFHLLIDKTTLDYRQPGTTSAVAVSWIDWSRGQNGTWPQIGTTDY